ncbi:MAG: prefoldin subunit beta [Nanoarchaeota archaeon]|nr:prefoldin subunit beta [Nanoarchaeota archaeon]
MNQETQQQLEQLQMLEQTLQNTIMQKQNFQGQILEIENAVTEVAKTKEQVYKQVGPIMIATPAAELKKELENKKEVLNLRLQNLDKQEKKLKEKFETLQQELMKHMPKE